jgi:hypothetical protein
MQLPRFVGLVDLGILTVIGVFAILPPRAQYTSAVMKGDEPAQFALALAEARTIARPGDGQAVDELTHKLDDAQQKDWAIDFAVLASEHAKSSPSRWKALQAASTAFVDHFDVQEGLDYANRALNACEAIRATDPAACPSPDQIRMQLYQANLAAGVASRIDPRKDRLGFMKAGERGLLQIHLDTRDKERGSAAPPSGSGGSADSASQGSATPP